MAEQSQALARRTDTAIALLESGDFLQRVEPLLPDTVPLRRFVQVAKTAIRSNPDLTDSKIDQRTLFNSLIRCAQDGLYPDNKEAALVPYKGKVNYLKMIDGIRRIAAEYGWTLTTAVVYANDEFDYTTEPPELRHREVRPGTERGERIASYAVARHTDGRRLQRVLHPDEIAKRRAKAQTQAVWSEWTDAMWRKSAAHALFDEIPKSERERMGRLTRLDDTDPEDAAAMLYGPDGAEFTATEIPAAAAAPTGGDGAHQGGGESQQAATAGRDAPAVAAPGDDDEEPEPGPASQASELEDAARVAGATEISIGNYKGLTIDAVNALGEEGEAWFSYVLRHPAKYDDALYAAVETFVQGALPDLWGAHAQAQAQAQAA